MVNVSMGMEGVVVAETELSDVDGERGRLVVRGHEVEDLVGRVPLEDVVALLWTGGLPGPGEREAWRAGLARGRSRAFRMLEGLGGALDRPDAMDALRAAAGHLSASGDDREDALHLTNALAVFAAAWDRSRSGLAVVEPDPSLPHAEDYLRMLRGGPERPVEPAHVRAMDAYLAAVVDHGLNASTLAARVVASTGSDVVSAVVAGLGALKGPLHGGAPGPVLDMLDAVDHEDGARAWLEGELAAGRRIMGMGHRVYRVRDPRAAALEGAVTELLGSGAGSGRLALARAVEREAEALLGERYPGRRLRANVEFYTAVLLEALGIGRELFTATFAVSRVAGWCAHWEEQRRRGRLMRPLSRYVGPLPAGGLRRGQAAGSVSGVTGDPAPPVGLDEVRPARV